MKSWPAIIAVLLAAMIAPRVAGAAEVASGDGLAVTIGADGAVTGVAIEGRAWPTSAGPAGLLLRGDELADAREWAQAHPDELNQDESAYLRGCRDAQEREQRERALKERQLRMARRFAVAMAVLALLFFLTILAIGVTIGITMGKVWFL